MRSTTREATSRQNSIFFLPRYTVHINPSFKEIDESGGVGGGAVDEKIGRLWAVSGYGSVPKAGLYLYNGTRGRDRREI